MFEEQLKNADGWLNAAGPMDDIVVSSRVRYARNLADHIFAPYAKSDELRRISDEIKTVIDKSSTLSTYERVMITNLSSLERLFLKESRLISAEMEKGGECREVYISKERTVSIMLNEEDHIRMQRLVPGLQLNEALDALDTIDDFFAEYLDYAFSPSLGFLTTCPTNTGTGLRASVMMHLPGMAMAKQTQTLLKTIQPFGLVARGFYGENSEFLGDFYQISNEISLGKSEREILDILKRVLAQLVAKEKRLREELYTTRQHEVEDAIWRSFALLSNARMMNSAEAMHLLSQLRLGIGRDIVPGLTHNDLNKLIISIQPAHLSFQKGEETDPATRDVLRAELLRKTLQGKAPEN